MIQFCATYSCQILVFKAEIFRDEYVILRVLSCFLGMLKVQSNVFFLGTHSMENEGANPILTIPLTFLASAQIPVSPLPSAALPFVM